MEINSDMGLALRVREIRHEIFGEDGGSFLADRLGLSSDTWAEFESGRTIPALVILRFVDLTHVNPRWLRTGRGDKYLIGQEEDGFGSRGYLSER